MEGPSRDFESNEPNQEPSFARHRILDFLPLVSLIALQSLYLLLFPGCVLSNLIIIADVLYFLSYIFFAERRKGIVFDLNNLLEDVRGTGSPKRDPACLVRFTHETRTLQKMFAVLQEIQSIEAKRAKHENPKLLASQVWVTKRALRCGNIVLTAKDDNHGFAAIVMFLRQCHLSSNFFDWTQFDEDCSKRERRERAKLRRDTLKAGQQQVGDKAVKEAQIRPNRPSRRRKVRPTNNDKDPGLDSSGSSSKLSYEGDVPEPEAQHNPEPAEEDQQQPLVAQLPQEQEQEEIWIPTSECRVEEAAPQECEMSEVLRDLNELDFNTLFPEDQFDEDDGWDPVSGEYNVYLRVRSELEASPQKECRH